MILKGRISVPEGEMPDPVKIDFNPDEYVPEARSEVHGFIDEGYAASGEEVPEPMIPDKSPVYSVEVLLPVDSLGEKNFPEEAYAGRSLEDRARMNGPAAEPEEVVDRIEDGYIYLMAVTHASEPEMDPELRLAEIPIEADLVNRDENLEIMSKVHSVVEELEHTIGFYDYTLWTSGYSDPLEAMEDALESEMKFAASIYTETPFHFDIGYLSSPQEEESEFGVEVRNRASEAIGDNSVQNAREAITEIVERLEDEGFDFGEEVLEMEI